LAVTRFADVESALREPRLVKTIRHARDHVPGLLGRPDLAQYFDNANMLRADPPERTRRRALAHQVCTPKLIHRIRDYIQSIADRLPDGVAPAGRMDLSGDVAFPLHRSQYQL
jgi:cytochrome P450